MSQWPAGDPLVQLQKKGVEFEAIMTDTSSSSASDGPRDGNWDDCDFPVSPQSSFVSGYEHVDEPELPKYTAESLKTALESCGQLMLSLRRRISRPPTSESVPLGNNRDADDLHIQVLALEQSMGGVFRQLRTLLNRARSINRLSPALLTTIFRLAIGPIKTTDLRDVLRLSSTCSNWRAIILNDGAMWSNIRLTGQDPSFVVQQVERCGGAPLRLFIDMPHTVFRVEGAPYLAHFKQIAPIIRVRRSQVESISATIGGCRAFQREFGLDWPNLEEFVWIDECPTGSRMHERSPPIPDKDHPAPKLRYLSAKQGLPWEMAPTTSLTTLKLEGPVNTDIFKLLQATPHLESLELIKLHVQASPTNATSIELPRLTRLTMRNVEYGQLFARVTFPSLRNLTVDPVEYREPPMEIVWGGLHVPPGTTTLKIEYLHHRNDKISITGSDGTKARSFSLTEHATLIRSTLMILALRQTSLVSVTSLSIGRGAPELGAQLPSTSICALVSWLPHLRRLDIYPSQLTLAVMKHLRRHPLVCPELRILSLTVVRETCEDVFWLLSGFLSDRADSKRWLHRVDCVILRAGEDPHEARRVWDSLSQDRKLGEYLWCSCTLGKDACRKTPCTEMYPTEKATFKRYSYCRYPHQKIEGGDSSRGQCDGDCSCCGQVGEVQP
ncbi:hypothetical protein BDM02DRAFT_890426 [Thelephora ganbajun]|uniref:Uncharacterized protein n=1 Tax=Thelephora ganbajun TaxID=370292 RepID=A0ACB6Z5H5_THEGA|nr:hypothetical protein BDM02DRAFT_890426 [Thelephora ganbajun]